MNIDQSIATKLQPSLEQVNSSVGKFALFRIDDFISAQGVYAASLDAARLCLKL